MEANKKSVEEILKQAERLPPLPMVAKKALRLLSDPNFNMRDLANILATDQAITSTMLRWANSSYFGLSQTISTLHQAIVFLGETTVRGLVLTAALASYMDQPVPGYDLDKGSLWEHSIGIAVTAQHIARTYGNKIKEEAYTAGLLADIGKLVMDFALRNMPQIDEDLSQFQFSDIESHFFGINHAELGAELAKRWGFPAGLQEAIAFHHRPEQAKQETLLPAIVNISDAVVNMLGIGIGRDGLQYAISPFALERLRMKETDIGDLIDQVMPRIIEAQKMIGLSIQKTPVR